MSQFLKTSTGRIVHAKDFLPLFKLSVHAFIETDGSVIDMVEPPYRASHAGKSSWNGLNGLNSHYLGVEVLVEGDNSYGEFIEKIEDPETFYHEQYIGLADLCAKWMKQYPEISLDTVVRHSDVSGVDVRPTAPKLDPGSGFDWLKFRTMLSIRVFEN